MGWIWGGCVKGGWRSCGESVCSVCAVVFLLSLIFFGRMGKIRDMREGEHGRYTEISDEKEVIRVSA